jgi:hypothetical protein
MGKRIISFARGWAKLAIVISLVLFGVGAQSQALAGDSHGDLASLTIVVAIDGTKIDCASVAHSWVPHRHNGNFYRRNCCGSACSIFAILTSVTAVPAGLQKNVETEAICPRLASFVAQNLHRPPIA